MKNSLVIVHSYHHGNTRKVADAITGALNAQAVNLKDANPADLHTYDLIGFGAGIDSGHHYAPLLEFARALSTVKDTPAFIFSTSAIYSEKKMAKDHKALRAILLSKGYRIVGEFTCKGYDTNSFLKYLGGLNKNRPNSEDLALAHEFALRLTKIVT